MFFEDALRIARADSNMLICPESILLSERAVLYQVTLTATGVTLSEWLGDRKYPLEEDRHIEDARTFQAYKYGITTFWLDSGALVGQWAVFDMRTGIFATQEVMLKAIMDAIEQEVSSQKGN